MPSIQFDYVKACATKNAPTGKAQKAAEEAAKLAKKKAAELKDKAYQVAHTTLPKTADDNAAKLAEAYRAAHGITV